LQILNPKIVQEDRQLNSLEIHSLTPEKLNLI